jgi:hypothetical protein
MDITKQIETFCDKHDACSNGREWALAHCEDMNEAWQTARPSWLVWIATREGVLTDNELRRFAVWSARQVQHLMTDERSVNALDVAERYANGAATDEELAAAHAAARAARAAAYAAYAADAAAYAADAAAYVAARAARVAAYVAYDAARAAAVCAAYDAASANTESAQAQWLRENTNPNFA